MSTTRTTPRSPGAGDHRLANPQRTTSPLTARLSLRVPGSFKGTLDGAWWPHSRDLIRELLPLLSTLNIEGHPVSRVVYRRSFWVCDTRHVQVGGRAVRLGAFTMPDANIVSFIDDTGSRRRLDVLVIAPDTDPAVAERILTQTATNGNALRATELLAGSYQAPADVTATV